MKYVVSVILFSVFSFTLFADEIERIDLKAGKYDSFATDIYAGDHGVFVSGSFGPTPSGRGGLSEKNAFSLPCYWDVEKRKMVELFSHEPGELFPAPEKFIAEKINVINGKVIVTGTKRMPPRGRETWVYWVNDKNGLKAFPEDHCVTAVYQYGKDVYFLGSTVNDSKRMQACCWKNGTQIPLMHDGQSLSIGQSIIYDGFNTYIAGFCQNKSGVFKACFWKNGRRTDIIDSEYNSVALNVCLVGKSPVVSGEYTNANGWGAGYYWQEGKLYSLAEDPELSSATDMAVSGNDIFISGHTWRESVGMMAYYWKNGKKTPLHVFTFPPACAPEGKADLFFTTMTFYY